MVRAEEFVKLVWTPLLEGWGYIYGTAGRLWTEALQRSWSEPPHKNWEKTKAYGSRWIGKTVTDCSGLICWALSQLGVKGFVHQARYQYTDASAPKGKLVNGKRDDGKQLLPGTAVFLQGSKEHIHHVGVYVGHNICIEAKGTQWGVVTSEPEHWDHWGELKVVDYTRAADIENEPIPEVPEHIKKDDGDPSQAQGAAGDSRPDTGTLYRVIVDNPGAWLNVRSGPGTGYPVLFRVEKGDVAEVLAISDDNKWDQIRCNGRIGWASAEYLSVVEEEPDAPDDVTEPERIIDALKDELKRMRDELDAFQELIDELEGMYHG